MKNPLTTNDKSSVFDLSKTISSGSDLRNVLSHLWQKIDFSRLTGGSSLEPKIEVTENKSNVTVLAEMPGITEKNIDVQITPNGSLTISAEKKDEYSSQDDEHYFSEISYGSVHRTIPLPWELDYSKAEAEFHDGILKVAIPKTRTEQQKSRKISVKKSESVM